MELFLVRHALAAPLPEGAGEEADAARPLTAKGIRRFRKVVRGLKALGVSLDLVLTSPKRRALETAELLAELAKGGTRVTPLLAQPPGGALLAEIPKEGRVALVGHEPYLTALLARLLLGDLLGASVQDFLEGRFLLKKGGVVWLEGRPGPGRMALRALLPPGFFGL
uniref:Phosphohistidine phosphatase n=2 Tax=Thermus islandicus TaxID=540988 RepID=A0A7C2GG91_9DEIN